MLLPEPPLSGAGSCSTFDLNYFIRNILEHKPGVHILCCLNNKLQGPARNTRLGSLQLRIPKLRQGSYFPPFLEPRKSSEKAPKAAIRRVFGATWQRCRVHWMRNALSYVSKTQQSMVTAALRQAFIQPDREQSSQMLRHVADQLRQKWPKLAAFIDDSEIDVLSYLHFPKQHRGKLHSTNPLERLNKEVKRRADVVGIFPNETALVRLIGAVLLEQNDEWQLQHRDMQVEAMAELAGRSSATNPRQIPCAA
ncbi:MAG: transposase [Acetobacteraceae bacterium]|nr:transposase [Acetobacteraceae bacterium]